MNMTQALRKITVLLGNRAGIKDYKRPSSQEQRDKDRAARLVAKAHKEQCEQAMVARRKAILDADTDYQRLVAEYNAASKAKDAIPFAHYRYCAGTSSSLFFTVAAEADTLDELVAKVRERKAA